MPDPAKLPPELFEQILATALRDRVYNDAEHSRGFNVGTDIRQSSQLMTVSRAWYKIIAARLYSQWSYNGARNSHQYLWRFVRTILSRPRLAEHVRALNVGNWGFYPDVLKADPAAVDNFVTFSNEDVSLMRTRIRSALHGSPNINALEAKILDVEALANRDCRPLVILLLICLPNLSTLYMHLPKTDLVGLVFEEILRCDENKTPLPCLHHLTYLYLLAEVPAAAPDAPWLPMVSRPVLTLRDFWPCLWFPSLRTLAVYDLDPEGAASLLERRRRSGKTCRLEELRLVVSAGLASTGSDIGALLSLTLSLTRLSLNWDQADFSLPDLWNALQIHRDTLEDLDIYYNASNVSDRPPAPFGSLQEFSQLKHLDIQTYVLYGMANEWLSSRHITEALPESIDTLVLNLDWANKKTPDSLASFVATEVTSLMAQRRRPLKLLGLKDGDTEESRGAFYYWKHRAAQTGNQENLEGAGPEPYPGIWAACTATNTQLRIGGRLCLDPDFVTNCHYHRGGACKILWRKTWDMRTDGLERSRMFVDRLPRPVKGHGRGWQSFPQRIHTVPFTDNAGNPALMVFENAAQIMYSTLPPLFPFPLYLTHPKVAPSPSQTKALVALYNTLSKSPLAFSFPFRLDVYFLPGGSEADCRAHYLAERASRLDLGTVLKLYRRLEFRYTRREDKLRLGQPIHRNLSRLRPPAGRLPGMQHEFPDLKPYKAFLLISPDNDWRDGEQRMSCVRFDIVGSSTEDCERIVAQYADVSDDEDDARPEEPEDEELNPADYSFDQDEDAQEREGNIEVGGSEEVEAPEEDSETNNEGEEGEEGEEEEPAINHPESITQSIRISEDSPRTDEDSHYNVLGYWLATAVGSVRDIPGYHLDTEQIRAAEMGWSNW
ncbi:hypothetical protein BJY01DRAFT_247348 [Aspergillus pseudoustus]|uniref:F-box domain-containing protein n=1 Tax=Aspergillus pseudoustus TaxID=1810923 RepID=A0ABR4K1G2_9EURO